MHESDPRRVAIFGTGKLAADLLRFASGSNLSVARVFTTRDENVGRDAGAVMLGAECGIPLERFTSSGLSAAEVHALLYAGHTGDLMFEVLGQAALAGCDSVTSVDMSISGPTGPAIRHLDWQARQGGARVLGSGLVPGFQLDLFPATIASTVPDPVQVLVRRVSIIPTWTEHVLRHEAEIGRPPTATGGTIRLYMANSMDTLTAALGVHPTDHEWVYEPAVAAEPCHVGPVQVGRGDVCGFRYTLIAMDGETERVRFDWISSLGDEGAEPEGTDVTVSGPEGVVTKARANLHYDGYPGTAARMLKSVRGLATLPPGLRSVVEVPLAVTPVHATRVLDSP